MAEDIITLSSEDEEEPVKKRIKFTTLLGKIEGNIQEDPCVVVLDDDDDDNDSKELKTNAQKKHSERIVEENQSEVNGTSNNDGTKVGDDTKDCAVENRLAKVSAGQPDCDDPNIEMESENNNIEDKFSKFLDNCMQSLTNSEHKSLVEPKLPIIKKLYEKLNNFHYALDELKEILISNTEKIKKNPKETVIYFSDVFSWLKSTYKEAAEARKTSEHNEKIIKKLEKTLLKIRKKIRVLEKIEVDYEDEENSSYLQLDRYMARASQIYTKLCKYRQENPHRGCLLYCRLDFSKSEYSEINKAINKKYKNNQEFPTYYDINKCIRNCVKENKLKISEENLKYEVKRCFEELGKLLQRRRQMDLYNNQRSYIENSTDPANENPEMLNELTANRSVGNKNLEEVMEKYTRLQEKGVDPNVSAESEDSHIAETESECEQDENSTENI